MPRTRQTTRPSAYAPVAHTVWRFPHSRGRQPVAVLDRFGLWHIFPEQRLGMDPGKCKPIKGESRIRVQHSARLTKLQAELLKARLEICDLQARLERLGLLHACEMQQYAAASLSSRRKIRADADRRIALFSHYSHDLKTPLSMLTVPLQQLVIDDASVPVRLKLQLEKIKLAIFGVLRTVGHSLDAARLLSRQQKPWRTPHVMTDFIRQVAEVYSIVFDSYGITLSCNLQPGVICEFDAIQFEKILNNLLSNTLKNNMPGGTVLISLQQAGKQAVLRIEDSGLGAHDRPAPSHLRNPWAFASHGYGLSIVRELVRLNRGKMQFHSVRGVGTTVTITLPAAPELANAALAARRHNFDHTLHEVELMAGERNALSRRRRQRASDQV